MTPQELELIKESQHRMRIMKGNQKIIGCPFLNYSASPLLSDPHYRCRVCHKWMETLFSFMIHPCDILSFEEIKERFWRSTIHNTSRKVRK